MFEKCTQCEKRILAGGHRLQHWRFCSDDCVAKFQMEVARCVAMPEAVAAATMQLFHAPCPVCGVGTHNSLYFATRLTGLLVAYRIESRNILGCAACARKHFLRAAGHCLIAGWWSVRSAFFNLFVLPINLIQAVIVREPDEPSIALTNLVLAKIGEDALPRLLSGELTLPDDSQKSTTENEQG